MAKLSEKKVIEQIDALSGNLTMVARSFQVCRPTMYKFIANHPKAKEALDSAREKMLDNVESALYNQALAGNTTAMIFFLKTQGKKRGYIERNEITGINGEGVTIKVTYDDK